MPNKKNPAATDLYCLECGAWQKFATRDEIRLYQTRKFVITNADRIRAMSDDELANIIECPYGNPYFDEHLPCKGSCHDCLLIWLQMPAEEGAN